MAKTKNTRKPTKEIHQNQNQKPNKSERPPSWAVVRSLFTCKHLQTQQQQQQQQHKKKQQEEKPMEENSKKCKKMKCSGSLCSNTKVMHRPEPSSPEEHKKRASMGSSFSNDGSSRSMKAPLHELNGVVSSSSSSLSVSSNSSIANGGSFRGMPFRRLSGCYECRMVVDPVLGFTRDPSLRASICSCPECGEIFMKAENLELHQAVRHAVSELGPEDTSKNIVEIIFQSSWLKKQTPVCKIDPHPQSPKHPQNHIQIRRIQRHYQSQSQQAPQKAPTLHSGRQRAPPFPLHHLRMLARSQRLIQPLQHNTELQRL
ncbi:hypothetical protein L1049_026889 [Liquidambar formosana]|uniref:C2H2-type domain-containing protein n=1 Tax=Liquidambar formosana TaxID=63359 RepID=A0AAP0NH78_LIQFO